MTEDNKIESLRREVAALREQVTFLVSERRRELSSSGSINKDLVDMGLVPCASIRQTVAQSVGEASWTKITMDEQVFDFMDGMSVDLSNDRIHARRAGLYLVIGQVRFAAGDADGSRYASVYVNGVATEGSGEFGGYASGLTTEIIRPVALGFVQVTVGSYFELFGYQNRGGAAALNTDVTVPKPFLTVCLMSRGNS